MHGTTTCFVGKMDIKPSRVANIGFAIKRQNNFGVTFSVLVNCVDILKGGEMNAFFWKLYHYHRQNPAHGSVGITKLQLTRPMTYMEDG